jgi:diaminopimelate epimerase
MGAPILDRREVPMAGAPGRHVDAPVDLGGREPLRLTAVSMGNPHAVVFTDAQPTGEAATDLSRRVLAAGLFPRGVNLEHARIRADGSVDVVVHERGVGLTLACGTGACAVAVGGALGGRLPYGREVPVHLPGGTLHIEVPEALDAVFMRGPAERVFDGEADLA